MSEMGIDRRVDSPFNWGPDGLEMQTAALDPFATSFLYKGSRREKKSYVSDQLVAMSDTPQKKKDLRTEVVLAKPSLPLPEEKDKPLPRIVVTPPQEVEEEAAAKAPAPKAKVKEEILEEAESLQATPVKALVTEVEEELEAPQTALEEKHALSIPVTADLEKENSRVKKLRIPSGLPTSDESTQEITGVNMIGSTWAKVIDGIFEARRSCQENANDLMHVQLKKRKVLDEKIVDNIRSKEEVKTQQAKWDFYKNLVECLWISGALAGGIALQGIGVTTGSTNAIWAGGEMTVGALLYLTSYSLKQIGYTSKYVDLFAWGGSALIAHGFTTGIGFLSREIPKTVIAATTSALTLTKGFTAAEKQRSIAEMHELEGANTRFQTERTENLDAIKKTSGGIKLTDLTKLARAASTQEEEREKLTSRILQESKA